MEDLRYPIGKFAAAETHTQQEIATFIQRIQLLPQNLEDAIDGLSDEQLNTPYREGGWTVKQVIHHVADSHMNAYIRIKWTLTEETPIIKAYNEKLWAETGETSADPSVSLSLIKALHAKWVTLAKKLTPEELQKQFIHPDTKKHIALHNLLGMYAWHGDHHLAHVVELKKRMKW